MNLAPSQAIMPMPISMADSSILKVGVCTPEMIPFFYIHHAQPVETSGNLLCIKSEILGAHAHFCFQYIFFSHELFCL